MDLLDDPVVGVIQSLNRYILLLLPLNNTGGNSTARSV